MHLTTLLPIAVFASFAAAGSHNFLNLYSDHTCSTLQTEIGLFTNLQCVNTDATGAGSVSTVLLFGSCSTASKQSPPKPVDLVTPRSKVIGLILTLLAVYGYNQANCTGNFVEMVSSPDTNTCVSSGAHGNLMSFQLRTTC